MFNNQTGGQLGFYYWNNTKAWMTSMLYQEWLQAWDQEFQMQDQKILLLQDNFAGHIIPGGLQNIHIENFTPNLTAHVQPMDQGIIRCFKAHYHQRFINEAVNCHDRGITALYIYDTDQLEVMCMAALAWDEVDATTIKNCWGKANILPSIDHPIIQPTIPISYLNSSDSCSCFAFPRPEDHSMEQAMLH